MNIDLIKDIMESYTDMTKITTVCLDSFQRDFPLYIKGLDFTTLLEYMEFKELLEFLASEHKSLNSMESNGFHTFYTSNCFIYNIVILKLSEGTIIELIAGPIMRLLPNGNSIDQMSKNLSMSIYKSQDIMGMINSIPLASNKYIYQLGKLLIILCNIQALNLKSPIQNIHRGKIQGEVSFPSDYIDDSDFENDRYELQDLYKFYKDLTNFIISGDSNGINVLLSSYGYLFWNIKDPGNSIRGIKDRCIIICTISCYAAIQANAPFERMLYILIKSVSKMERLLKGSDIIQTMINTVNRYTHFVAAIPENNHSVHINRMLQYIRNHFSEKITLKHLAEYVHVNPVYLSSLINKETSMSLSNHINSIRIEESKKLLVNTNKSIQEVAFAVGYNYQNHFNTVFKKFEGITPLEYRRNKGDKNYTD